MHLSDLVCGTEAAFGGRFDQGCSALHVEAMTSCPRDISMSLSQSAVE